MKNKILAAIIFVAGVTAEFVINKMLDNFSDFLVDKKIENAILSFLFQRNYSFAIIIISCFIVFFLTFFIYRLFSKVEKSSVEKKQEKFLKKCPKSLKVEDNMVLEYSVRFGYYDDLPYPYNIIIKCSKDGSNSNTVLDNNNYCVSAAFCKQRCAFRERISLENKEFLKKQIQSELITYWGQFNNE